MQAYYFVIHYITNAVTGSHVMFPTSERPAQMKSVTV